VPHGSELNQVQTNIIGKMPNWVTKHH